MGYDDEGNQVVGPVSHAKTVSLAVAPSNAAVVAVTGWPNSVEDNGCVPAATSADASTAAAAAAAVPCEGDGSDEVLLLSRDAGGTWADVMGDLAAATATVGKVRPSGLLVFELAESPKVHHNHNRNHHKNKTTKEGVEPRSVVAVVAGTVAGVYVTFVGASGAPSPWARLGACGDLPLVYVMNLEYEYTSDTIVAASMGRGIYTLANATSLLQEKLGSSRA